MENKMSLETILRKFVRLPWEVCETSDDPKDEEISDYVAYQAFAGTGFRTPPQDERQKQLVLQSIANVMVISFLTQGGEELTRHNRFKDLSGSEKLFLYKHLGIDPLEHDSVLQITKNEAESGMISSYVAAAYAFTTRTKVFVVNFEKLSDIAYYALNDTSQEEKRMKTAGLLIFTGLGTPARSNETVYAFMQNILSMRGAVRRMNIFYDIRHGEILRCCNENKLPTRKEAFETYMNMFPLSYRLDCHLVGPGVHIPAVDKYAGEKNESGSIDFI